ncbi:hypothetical protein DEM34_04250 [Spiribacter halobius]|uniref:Uncharacterized protein n=1 Tax=Sediminicurvatus halobius TaxID=2182432 RepID=A0A2U2N5Q6_9GAMM|nr:hypothetical protein DEM34_04250 [Spiribacter halobius]
MQMPSAGTERALEERIARLRAELRTLEHQRVARPSPQVHFRTACAAEPVAAGPMRREPPRTDGAETPLPIAAG